MDPSAYPDATLGQLGEQLRVLETAIADTRIRISELTQLTTRLTMFEERLTTLKAEIRRRLA